MSEVKADNGKSNESSVYNDLLAHRDVICLPQLRFGGTLLSEYAARISQQAQTPPHGHRLRTCCTTPPTDELATILQQICHIAMPKPNISTCPDVGMWQILSVGSCRIVVSSSVGGVRWWCPLPARCCTTNLAGYGRVVQHLQLVVRLSVGGVRSRCPCSGVWH